MTRKLLFFSLIILYTACNSPKLNNNTRGLKVHNTATVKLEKQKEQRIALIVGNNNYSGVLSKLSNPINDAKAIKFVLQERGFQVIYAENNNKRQLMEKLNKFYTHINKGGVGLLYFSGHGIEVDGQNYLIPIDAKIKEKSDIEFETIPLNKILKRMQNIGNRLNIVILDACRNDPFSRALNTGGLAKTEPIGIFVSFSTGAGEVASDGTSGENGLFTKSLLKNMQKNLTLQDVFKKTRAEVYEQSNHRQFPAIYDQTINGEFYFTRGKVQKASPIPTITSTPQQYSMYSKKSINLPKKQNIAYTPNLIIADNIKDIVDISSNTTRIINGMMEIVLDLKNNTNKEVSLHYKVKWFNTEGFQLNETLSLWQPIFIDPNDTKKIREIAPMPSAGSCKIYFK